MLVSVREATFVVVLVILLGVSSVASLTIRVPSNVDPSSPGSLQGQLCGASPGVSSDTEFVLEAGQHNIDSPSSCIHSDMRNLTFTSEEGATVVCSSALEGHGFIFLNVSSLTIANIRIKGCGRAVPPNLPSYVNNTFFYIGQGQKAALLVSRVTDFQLQSVTFTGSYGYSVLAVDLRGSTRFTDVTITETDNYRHPSCYGNETNVSCSGAGAAFLYSDSELDELDSFNSSSLTLTNCTFTHNNNIISNVLFVPLFINVRSSFESQDILVTGGTAMAVYFGQNSYKVPVTIESCNISHNFGYSSAVVLVTHSSLRQYVVDIRDSTLEFNRGNNLARGGAIIALIITYLSDFGLHPEYPDDIFQFFRVYNSSFVSNSAPIGGSIYFYISPQNLTSLGISFDGVRFIGNQAEVGSAFEVNTRQATFKQREISVLMNDIVATNNLFATANNDTVSSANIVENSAAFVFTGVFNITVSGSEEKKSLFAYNSPGAFLILGGNFYMKGHLEFLKNRALRGGAISLYDYALLFFHEGSHINFTKNSALEVGGAIYANSLGTGTAPTCVFQVIGPNRISSSRDVGLLNMSLRFMNNSANQGGNSIYVNPLYNCAYLPESSLLDTTVFYDASIVYNSIFTFEDSIGNGLRELSSIPERLCYCTAGEVKTSSSECSKVTSTTALIYPGQQLTIHAFPTDLNFNPVSAVIFAELMSSEHFLKTGQYTQQLNGANCTSMRFNVLGKENTTTTLSLYTRLGASRLIMDIHLLKCPPGFFPNDDEQSCTCESFITDVVGSFCDLSNYTVTRLPNLWLGVMEQEGDTSDVIYIPTCPAGFCQDIITSVDLTIEDQLCFEGRTGILCGACQNNYSVVFGSPFCRQCSNYWLFTIFLYALAGIVLVTVLFTLELTVTHGTLTSIIFYANIVGLNSNILFPVEQRGFLFIWISILNLELGFPLCFYDGMNEAAKTGLQAVFPFYLLFICLTIILLSEKSNRVAKWTSSHGVQVLATTVYLSFSKMLRYVIDILTFVKLYGEEKSEHVWFYDGNLKFFNSAHIVIAVIVALPTLLFIIGFTLAMLLIKLIEQKSSKLKPFLDVYGAPFVDRHRYWFGLRLVILAGMCLSFAVLSTNSPVLAFVIQLVILCLFMVTQSIIRPYRQMVSNLTDISFMLNFFLMVIFVIYAYQSFRLFAFDLKLRTIVSVFVSLAFIHFSCIIVWYIIKSLYRIGCVKKKLQPHVTRFKEVTLPFVHQKARRLHHSKSLGDNSTTVAMQSISSLQPDSTRISDLTAISSTDVSLGNAVNADTMEKILTRKVTYSHYRESIIED